MELKEFIRETLLQITQGVHEAQQTVKEYGAIVNPAQYQESTDTLNAKIDNQYRPVQNVNFEVALASSNSEGNKTGIGVLLGSFNIGTSNHEDSKLISVTNVRFSVPLVLPSDDIQDNEDLIPISYSHSRNDSAW